MKLRFNISEPINTGSPDYTICNQASSFVGFNDLTLVVKVDGTNIINTVDLSSVSFPIAPITTTNGLSVSASLSGSYITLDINLANVWDSTTVQFQIEPQAGYWNFNKIFEVYGYDLGNDGVVTGNPDFTLYLINKTNNEVSGVQTKAFSSFIAYRRPFTSEVHYYKSNSGNGGSTLYYDSDLNLISSNVDGFVCTNDIYELFQKNIINTSICTSDSQTLIKVVNIPTFQTNTTCVSCDEECVVINTSNTSTSYIDYSLLTTYMVDDIEVNPYLTQTLIYRLIDFTGNVLQDQTYTFNINPLPFAFDPTAYTFAGFQIPDVGDYIIQVELSVPNLYKCTKNYPISACNFYEIKNTDCNAFTVYNKSFEDFTLTISELQDDKSFLEISSVTVPALDNVVISHTSDNVYTYTVIKNDITYIYVVVNYCNLRNCLLLGLTNLICPKTKGDCTECRAKDYYNFNALIINAHTYFNMLNAEYNFNYFYDALSVNKINELYDLKSFLVRFEEYCVECNKICNCS